MDLKINLENIGLVTGIFLLPINYVDGTSCIFSFLDLGVSFFFFIEGRSAA